MARGRGSFSGRAKAPQRQIANFAITGEIDGLVPVAGLVKAQGSFGVGLGQTDAATLVRTRGQFMALRSSVPAAQVILRGVLGIIIVSTDAQAIGISGIPGPLTDSENDWVVWSPFTLLSGSSADFRAQGQSNRVDFDSRGMRKMKIGDVLSVVVEVEADVAGGAVDIGYAFRQQFKL